MRRATVRCDTSKPSLSSSWMRGAPQRGLARAMVRTRWAIAEPIDGRPVRAPRDFHVQKARKPCRCQRITVSGRTTWSASRHPAHRRESHTQKARSRGPNRGRFERVAEQGELLPERQILKRKISAVPERSTRRAQESEYEGHCAPASLGVIPSSSVTIEFWQTTAIGSTSRVSRRQGRQTIAPAPS